MTLNEISKKNRMRIEKYLITSLVKKTECHSVYFFVNRTPFELFSDQTACSELTLTKIYNTLAKIMNRHHFGKRQTSQIENFIDEKKTKKNYKIRKYPNKINDWPWSVDVFTKSHTNIDQKTVYTQSGSLLKSAMPPPLLLSSVLQ